MKRLYQAFAYFHCVGCNIDGYFRWERKVKRIEMRCTKCQKLMLCTFFQQTSFIGGDLNAK